MATSETNENICRVCLEAPAVRKVDTCEHSYCETCLSPPNFACPQCVTADEEAEDQADHASRHGKEEQPDGSEFQELATKDQINTANSCKICHFKGNTVKDTHVCIECRKLPLCANCAVAHRQNEATQKHVLTVLARARDDQCTVHDEPLVLVCRSCSDNVCHVCISIEHVGHKIESINSVVFVELDNVRTRMEDQEKWLEMLKCDEKELRESKATAQAMEDVLIKSIEDHAEKCIEEIIQSKEALTKQVRDDLEVVRVMEKRLAAMSELQMASVNAFAAASGLLNEHAELHLTYVEKLVTLKEQLDKLKEDHSAYAEEKAKYQQSFKELFEKAITLYPRTPNCKIGSFKDPGPRCNAVGPCVCEKCEKAFKLAHASREGECRERKRCVCGTCECEFNREKLYGIGRCAYISNGSRCGSLITAGYNRFWPHNFS